MLQKAKVIRQGDVWITLNQELPEDAVLRKDKTVAYGEVTGHHHTLTAEKVQVFGELAGVQWIVAEEESPLTHQEHDTLMIPPGIHEVHIQREYSPTEIRRVFD